MRFQKTGGSPFRRNDLNLDLNKLSDIDIRSFISVFDRSIVNNRRKRILKYAFSNRKMRYCVQVLGSCEMKAVMAIHLFCLSTIFHLHTSFYFTIEKLVNPLPGTLNKPHHRYKHKVFIFL